MPHTYLSLDMTTIPQATKDNVPTFWQARFSNDGVKDDQGNWIVEPSRILIDGYNDKRELVHTDYTFSRWLQWESDYKQTLNNVLSTSIEYTNSQFFELSSDVESIWHLTEVLK